MLRAIGKFHYFGCEKRSLVRSISFFDRDEDKNTLFAGLFLIKYLAVNYFFRTSGQASDNRSKIFAMKE